MTTGADIPQWPEHQAFIQELNTESASGTERGLVLLCTSMLEELLKRLIKGFLAPGRETDRLLGDDGEGALSSFAARIDAAYALGFLTKLEHQKLHIIRKLRNDAAHRVGLFLSSPPHLDRCNELTKDYTGMDWLKVSPKGKVSLVAAVILGNLSARIPEAQSQRRTARTAP